MGYKKSEKWSTYWLNNKTSYIDMDVDIDSADQRKREKAIFHQIIKQILADDDRFYIEHDESSNSHYYVYFIVLIK